MRQHGTMTNTGYRGRLAGRPLAVGLLVALVAGCGAGADDELATAIAQAEYGRDDAPARQQALKCEVLTKRIEQIQARLDTAEQLATSNEHFLTAVERLSERVTEATAAAGQACATGSDEGTDESDDDTTTEPDEDTTTGSDTESDEDAESGDDTPSASAEDLEV